MSFCECGCGREVKPGNRFINGHNVCGLKRSDETRAKMRVATKRRFGVHPVTDSTKRKIRLSRIAYFEREGSREANGISQTQRFIDHPVTEETRERLSVSITNSDAHKDAQKRQVGGMDIVQHHYIYDHSDLSLNTVGMTRSDHSGLHLLLRRLKYIVPHINDNRMEVL